MNVWIVSSGEPLPIDEGRPRLRRMGMLSKILIEEGNEVHWFSSSFHHYKKKHRSENDKQVIVTNDYTIHLIKTAGYKKNVSLKRMLNQRELAKRFLINTRDLKKPDIIIATLAPLQLSEAVINYGEENNVPIVVDIRDLWPEIFNEVVPKWAKGFVKPYIWYCNQHLKEILNKSTSIVGVTPNFLNYGLDLANIEKRKFDKVFYTSYKPRNISSEIKNFDNNWSKFGLKSSDFIVVFLGNFGRQFVLEPILEAASNLKGNNRVKFVLCGVGESFEKIRELSTDLDNVVLPGWIEEKQILSLLSAASVGIAPYRNSINFTSNTPNKFGEYLSASLPVLLGIEGVMADLVSDYKCGEVYNNSNELARIIEKLSLESNTLNDMSINAKKLYEDKFNADKVYRELSNHLLQVAKSNDIE